MDAPVVVSGISNIMLAVHGMDRSVAFYRDVLGLPVRFASPNMTFLRAGAVTICLRLAPGAPAAEDGRIEVVFDAPDIHAAYAQLSARGVAFRLAPRVITGNLWAADFRDPDGNILSIFGPAADEAGSAQRQP